ncbi:MAG: 1-deoxy-D-xylulose-5-phosphate synthase [Lachnospiraceae bacterium]|nr:1-deoxy-D-xylulose-5-phosphate synthase [Lachnospiraceae bacterium]
MILDRITGPNDIKKLKPEEYGQLAGEIREFLINTISVSGGHLASNLGVVELTMALHLVLDLPKDKIIWDVGHQSYTHKLLTGRREAFEALREYGGLSGFPKRTESACDAFNTGHSSTSISAGLGIAAANKLNDSDGTVVSVIGDGALTGGMAYEALNNAAQLKRNFIIILNDNEMSISANVGGVSKYLNNIRTGQTYNKLKKRVLAVLSKIPGCGNFLINKIRKTKSGIKQLLIPGMLFEDMGIKYIGPIDGHDIERLVEIIGEARNLDKAVMIHVITKKGKGFAPAEERPEKFHGVGPFDVNTGDSLKVKKTDYTTVFSNTLIELAHKNPKLVAITAAMPDGTGLAAFKKEFPDRFFDVGIAEEHAVTFAAGMASEGLKPVVAVYSSFLQRAYDQILHDVCIQDLPVVFALDRAGLVGNDGETHQGIFDLSYLTSIPNMSIFAPKNARELKEGLEFAAEYSGPIALRYPRGTAYQGLEEFAEPVVFGKSEVIYREKDIALLAVGSMVEVATEVRDRLKEAGYHVTLVNARFVRPIDEQCIDELIKTHSLLVTLEENVLNGGYGEKVVSYVNRIGSKTDVLTVALPNVYVEHGNIKVLRQHSGIDAESVTAKIIDRIKGDN